MPLLRCPKSTQTTPPTAAISRPSTHASPRWPPSPTPPSAPTSTRATRNRSDDQGVRHRLARFSQFLRAARRRSAARQRRHLGRLPGRVADAGLKAATIARRLVVISQAHKAADLPSPTTSSLVRRTHAGIRRSIGTAQTAKAPAVVDDLKHMLEHCLARASGSGIARCCCSASPAPSAAPNWWRSTSPTWSWSSAGLAVTLRKSKTDQEGRSRRIGIPYGSSEKTCPVRSLQAWLETARIVDGAVFGSLDKFQRVQSKRLSDKAVARIMCVTIRLATRDIRCGRAWRPVPRPAAPPSGQS